MAKEEHDFVEDIKINKYKLEIECEQHASLYFYWAEKLAQAKNRLNAAKEEAELTASKTGQHIRANWDTEYLSDFEKSTEKSIATALKQDKDTIASSKNVAKAQDEVNILSAAVSAFDHRKSELDNLVTLLVKGFYAAPNGGKREGAIETTERDIRKKLNKGK